MLSDEEIADWLIETEKQNLEREKKVLHIYEEEISILKNEILLLENEKMTKEVSIDNIPNNIIEDRKNRAKLEHNIILQFLELTQEKLLIAISKYNKQSNIVSEFENIYKNAFSKALILATELA